MTRIRTRTDWADEDFDDTRPAGTAGLLALATDVNIEDDLRGLLPSAIRLCTTRMSNTNPITAETLRQTADRITPAAAGILPGQDLDVLVYGCTAGAAVIGDDTVERLLLAAKPGARCLSPVSAAAASLRHLGIRRLSILTPNVRPLNEAIADYFANEDFDVDNITGFELRQDPDITRVPPSAIVDAARETCTASADGLLICCTSLRVTPVIGKIESMIGRPVVTSNQALAWAIADALGQRLN